MTLLLPGPPGHSGDARIDRCGAPVTRPLPATSDHQVALDDMLRDGDRLSILVWRYHDDDLPGADAAVPLKLRGLPRAFSRGAVLTHYRIDGRHLNSFATWQAMGSPLAPADAQRAALLRAARLATIDPGPVPVATGKGRASLAFSLPRQKVSLLVLTPGQAAATNDLPL